jgi:hypothetical protein
MKRSHTLLLTLSAVWGLSFVGAATTVHADDLIHACKKNNVKNATIRILSPGSPPCKANETEITWPSQVSENGGANANNGTVKTTNVKINNGDNHVSPGASFTVTFDYNLAVPGCPGCVAQLYVGLSSDATPQTCPIDTIPGVPPGITGGLSVSLTAPSTPGVYIVGIDTGLAFFCQASWPNGAPTTDARTLGVISVY